MQKLTQHGILNLGGEGEYQIEVEYANSSGDFCEGVYLVSKVPTEDQIEQAILSTGTIADERTAWIILTLSTEDEPIYINLIGGCEDLTELRLPCGTNIVDKFIK